MIRIASMSGEQEFTALVGLFDASLTDRMADNKLNIPSRIAVIEEAYRSDGNATAAFGRLEELLGRVHGNTPQEHIDLIAGIAKVFAKIGSPKRALELLVRLHSNTLGYALPAKKNPQYSLWGDLLESSDSQDPSGSGERILLALKQLSGMALTEGNGAAHRLAPRVVVEAAMHSSALGYRAVRLLTSKGLLSTRLVHSLLNGDSDEPAEALQLLFRDEEAIAVDGVERVLPLANTKDYVVASFAGSLLDRWGYDWAISAQELPLHYRMQMATNRKVSSVSRLTNPSSGAMLVNDPLGWTELFTTQVKDLARAGTPETTIRYRCASLIESWGGLEKFGQSETERRLSELERLNLRITYSKPHIVAALRVLRHVTGEFHLSGLLEPRATPQLLYRMNYQVDLPPLRGLSTMIGSWSLQREHQSLPPLTQCTEG